MRKKSNIWTRLDDFAELAMLGAMLPLVGICFILLSPMALLGWVTVKTQDAATNEPR